MTDISAFVTDEQAKQIIEQRINEWSAQAYYKHIGREAALAANPAVNTAGVDAEIAELTRAIEYGHQQLTSIVDKQAAS